MSGHGVHAPARRAARGPAAQGRRPPVWALGALTRLWWRGAAPRRVAVMLVVTFALLAAVFVSVASFNPSPTRQSDQLLGPHQQLTSARLDVGEVPADVAGKARAALAGVAPGAEVSLTSEAVTPDALPKLFVNAAVDPVRAIEDAHLRRTFPGRYTLDSGRWPAAPGEVAISAALRHDLSGQGFTVLSGQGRWRIVGVVTDAHDRHGNTMITGPGTLEALRDRAPAYRYQPDEIELDIRWGARGTPAQVAAAIAPLLPPAPEEAGASRVQELTSGAITRASLAGADKPAPVFATDRFAVSYLPLAVIALLVAAFTAATTAAVQRGDVERLVAAGVARSILTATRTLAAGLAAAAWIALGLGAGWLIAWGLRAAWLYRVADQPLAPLPGLNATLLAIAAGALAVVLAGAAWSSRPTSRRRARRSCAAGATSRPAPSRVLAWLARGYPALIRRALVIALVLAALRADGGVYSLRASYLVLAAIVLAAPDALVLVVAALPRARARPMLTRSMMSADLRRQGAAVVVLAACIAIPVVGGTQLASRAASDAGYQISVVPPGQIWIQGNDSSQDLDGVAAAVAAVPGVGEPITVRSLFQVGNPPKDGDFSISFTKFPTGPGSFNSSIMVLDSADQARRLLGEALPAQAQEILAGGGVVDFLPVTGRQSFTIDTIVAGQDTYTTTKALPTARYNPGKTWRNSYQGVVLASTVEDLGLPVSADGARPYFTGVSPKVQQDAVAAAVAAGYDARFVQYRTPPPPIKIPAAAWIFLAALAAGTFAVLLIVVGGQAARLRAYSARLVAIGLTPRWTRGILAIQAGLSVGVALIAGIAAGLAGVWITADHYVRLVIPTTAITIAVVAVIIAAATATVLAARRLSATEQPQIT